MPRDIFGNLIKKDIFGRRISKKQLKREVIAENRQRGKIAEESAVLNAAIQGIEYKRTGRGHDFKAYRTDILTGKRKFLGYREIKSGNAKLSKLQQKTKKKKSNYKVIREKSYF